MTKICKNCKKETLLMPSFTFIDEKGEKVIDHLCNDCRPNFFFINDVMYTFEQFKALKIKGWKYNDVKGKYPGFHGEQIVHQESAAFVGTVFPAEVEIHNL